MSCDHTVPLGAFIEICSYYVNVKIHTTVCLELQFYIHPNTCIMHLHVYLCLINIHIYLFIYLYIYSY